MVAIIQNMDPNLLKYKFSNWNQQTKEWQIIEILTKQLKQIALDGGLPDLPRRADTPLLSSPRLLASKCLLLISLYTYIYKQGRQDKKLLARGVD